MKKTILFDSFTKKYNEWCEIYLNRSKIVQRYNILNNLTNDRPSGIVLVINEDDTVIKYTKLEKCARYGHDRLYVKSNIICSLTVYKKNKKIKFWSGNNNFLQNPLLYRQLFKYLKIDWFDQIKENVSTLYMNKTLFEGIIFGRITNPENFYKKIMSVSFKIPKSAMISWRLIKAYIECEDYIFNKRTLSTIINHTTNVNKALEKVVKCKMSPDEIKEFKAEEWLEMFSDSLKDAEILDKKINPLWSFKRLRKEHVDMTRLINSFLIEEKNCLPIYFESEDKFLSCRPNNSVKLLKSEKDVYAEGTTMSHCLYNGYWRRIKNKEYFAFSAEYPERCTIGVRPNYYSKEFSVQSECKDRNEKFILEQIYKKYDNNVTDETREYFEKWIDSDKMQEFFRTNFKKLKPETDIELTNNVEIKQIAV